jgi:hypothetical protein
MGNEVDSQAIELVDYRKNGDLFVTFKTGTTYQYEGVPSSVYTDLVNADSKGKFFVENIRTNFPCLIITNLGHFCQIFLNKKAVLRRRILIVRAVFSLALGGDDRLRQQTFDHPFSQPIHPTKMARDSDEHRFPHRIGSCHYQESFHGNDHGSSRTCDAFYAKMLSGNGTELVFVH